MSIKEKVAQKVLQKETKDIKKYLESVGAYLELILETNRELLNEVRVFRGKKRLKFEDEEQVD